MQAQRICKKPTHCLPHKDIRQAPDRKKWGSYAAVTAKAVKPKKDESQIVNISDITAEGELRQRLQTVLINYQRRADCLFSSEESGPLRICWQCVCNHSPPLFGPEKPFSSSLSSYKAYQGEAVLRQRIFFLQIHNQKLSVALYHNLCLIRLSRSIYS